MPLVGRLVSRDPMCLSPLTSYYLGFHSSELFRFLNLVVNVNVLL